MVRAGEGSLLTVSEAMTSGDPADLKQALASLSDESWEELHVLIGSGATVEGSENGEVEKAGNVILLPGIMGTDLAEIVSGAARSIWFNLSSLRRGGFAKLAVPSEGEPAHEIKTGGLIRLFYLPMQTHLGIHWRPRLSFRLACGHRPIRRQACGDSHPLEGSAHPSRRPLYGWLGSPLDDRSAPRAVEEPERIRQQHPDRREGGDAGNT